MSGTRMERLVSDLLRAAQRLEVPASVEERFAKYVSDPVGFALHELHVTDLPEYQRALLRDVAEHERVAWVAGHATGKSYAAALLVAWYLCTRPGSRVIITSATFERQVGRIVFAKLRTLAVRGKLPLLVSATRAQVVGHPEWSAEGVPSAKPENFAGFHADRMLVIADEAKALDRPVFEELQGVLASATVEARLLVCSTAGPAQGYFYERFQRHADTWRLHRTPSTESPFATGFAERMAEECLGPEDPVFKMRVLAQFAEDVEGQLLKLSDIYAATSRVLADDDDAAAPVTLGVDVARFGDDRSVVAVARGHRLCELIVWRGLDTMQTAERVGTLINAHRAQRVFVDEVGVGGGPLDRLRAMGYLNVIGVNAGAGAYASATFANRRAEMGWGLRAKFERGEVAIPDDPGLVSELASLRYTYNPSAKIICEPKDRAKARLGRSPDLADATCLALVGAGRARASTWRTSKVVVSGGHVRIVDANRVTPWGQIIEHAIQTRDPLVGDYDPVHGPRPPAVAPVPEMLPTVEVWDRRLHRRVVVNATAVDPARHEKLVGPHLIRA